LQSQHLDFGALKTERDLARHFLYLPSELQFRNVEVLENDLRNIDGVKEFLFFWELYMQSSCQKFYFRMLCGLPTYRLLYMSLAFCSSWKYFLSFPTPKMMLEQFQ